MAVHAFPFYVRVDFGAFFYDGVQFLHVAGHDMAGFHDREHFGHVVRPFGPEAAGYDQVDREAFPFLFGRHLVYEVEALVEFVNKVPGKFGTGLTIEKS